MKSYLLAAAGAMLFLGACSTTMDEEMVDAPPPVAAGMTAATYVPNAASSDLFEIQSGQLALQRACDPAVRSFAQMIIADHTRMSNMMMQTAQQAGLPPPPMQMAPHHMEMLQRLQTASPEGFDAAFRSEQVMAHQEALTLHRTYADEGDVPALRALAAQAVGPIEMHLNTAQTLPTTTPCAGAGMTQPSPRRGERG